MTLQGHVRPRKAPGPAGPVQRVAGQDLHERVPSGVEDREVTEDPEAVYLRIKNKHLMFGESREEREVRIDGEHQALVKGRLSGHQFEPLLI